MTFVIMEPEASGWPAVGTDGKPLEYVFDTWLGDDVVRAHPAVLVTTAVKRAIEKLANPTGFLLSRARVRSSSFFRRHSPGRRLPVFWLVTVLGQPGRTDLGLTSDGALVVSQRMLSLLLKARVRQATFEQYVPGKRGCRRTSGCS